MTHEEFISIVDKPELVTNNHVFDLKELVDSYPYFASARIFHTKALKQSNSIQFATSLRIASLYCSSRRWLYYYLYPEKLIVSEPYRRSLSNKTKSAGDYFDMIDSVESEGGDTKLSLKNLAERLKMARSIVASPTNHRTPEIRKEKQMQAVVVLAEETVERKLIDTESEVTEELAKKLIAERKYAEAIEILRALNLNNPKKSIYFADQIRFLEKIITNSKK